MGSLAGQKGDTGWAALGDCAEVATEKGALVGEVLFDGRLVVKRVHVQILVIGHDEDEVRLGFWLAKRALLCTTACR